MRNIDFISLTDAQRGQLFTIWLLAADHDGAIPASAELIQKLCYMQEAPDIEVFVIAGFIERGAIVTPCRRQHDSPEESRGEKNRIEESRARAAPPCGKPVDNFSDKERLLIPDDYQANTIVRNRLKTAGSMANPDDPQILEKFKAYHQGVGTTSNNWDALYVKWCLTEKPKAKNAGDNRNARIRQEFAHLDNDGTGSHRGNVPALSHGKKD